MTPSPDLIHELRASRPAAPADLRARVRELAAAEHGQRRRCSPGSACASPHGASASSRCRPRPRSRSRPPVSLGLARSDAPTGEAFASSSPPTSGTSRPRPRAELATEAHGAIARATSDAGRRRRHDPRARHEPRAARQRHAHRRGRRLRRRVLVRPEGARPHQRLGGHVVSASVVTGEGANATITVRVPVARVQEAVVQLSALGTHRLAAGHDRGPPGDPRPARAAGAVGAGADRDARRPPRVRLARRRDARPPRGAAEEPADRLPRPPPRPSPERTPRRGWRRSSSPS